MALEEELEYFKSIKNTSLAPYKGKFALIKGKKLIDAFTTSEEAYQAGVSRFGTEPFLIKEVADEETVESIPALNIGNLHAHP